MCGELIVFGSIDATRAMELFDSIAHRGPEHSRLDISKGVTIGFARLALSDPHSCSMQPLTIRSFPDVTLVYNGEIYDAHPKIKSARHDTELDGEDLLRSVMDGTQEVMDAIRGVYAAVIIDRKKNRVHILHDRTGVRGMWTCEGPEGQRAWASEYQGLPWLETASIVPGGVIQTWDMDPESGLLRNCNTERKCSWPVMRNVANGTIWSMRQAVFASLMKAVERRWVSRDPRVRVACLLSGGLDSSFVYCASTHLARKRKEAPPVAFTGVMVDALDRLTGTDVVGAIKTSKALELSDTHHLVAIDPSEAVDVLTSMPKVLGTSDPTSQRASTMMFIVMKALKKMVSPDTKIVMSGEGADEACAGYTNMLKAPSPAAMDAESRRLLDALPKYDNRRADAIISRFGMEGRFPFLDVDFISTYLSVPPELRMPGAGLDGLAGIPESSVGLTKSFLRGAIFACEPNMMHSDTLWGTKKAFSDSTSGDASPWHLTASKYAETFSIPPLPPKFPPAHTKEEALYQAVLNAVAPNLSEEAIVQPWRPAFVPSGVTSARLWEAEKATVPDDADPSSLQSIATSLGVSWYRALTCDPGRRTLPRYVVPDIPPAMLEVLRSVNRMIHCIYASSIEDVQLRFTETTYGTAKIYSVIDMDMDIAIKSGEMPVIAPNAVGMFNNRSIAKVVLSTLSPIISKLGPSK